jgi:RNA polymerase sigma-70 factor (ECF subfamily)
LNYCRGLCRKGKIDEAEDIFQDSLLKALESFERLDDESKIKNWFFTIITNTYISNYRRRLFGKFLSINEFEDIDKLPDIFPRIESKDVYDDIYIAISGLKEKEKIALLLFEVGGFSIEEIKIIQKEKSDSAVKSRLSRTRDKLKKIINNLETNRNKRLILKSAPIDNLEIETLKIIKNIKPEN